RLPPYHGLQFHTDPVHQPSTQHGACFLPDVRAVNVDRSPDHDALVGGGAKAADAGGATDLSGFGSCNRACKIHRQHEPDSDAIAAIGQLPDSAGLFWRPRFWTDL